MKTVSAKDINKVISTGNLFFNQYYNLLYNTPEGDLLDQIRNYEEKKQKDDKFFGQLRDTFAFNAVLDQKVSIINDEPLFE